MRKLALLSMFLALPLFARAQYGRMDFSLQSAQGQAIPGATINVYAQPSCGAPYSGAATLYPAATGGTPLTQPLSTDGFGSTYAYAASGCYTVIYFSNFTGTRTLVDQVPTSPNTSSISVNGSPVTTPNFNGTTPAAPSGSSNCTFQTSASFVSCYFSNTSAGLSGGAVGSAPYQSAANTTAFITSPTTSGHYFVYSWQPTGSAIHPVALDLATWYATLTINATQVNGASVPASALFAGANSSHQIIAATTGDLATFLSGLAGCSTTAYAYVPADGECEAIGGGFTSPLTTKGDILGYSSTNARVPVGSNGQVLTADSTQTLGIKWATPSGGSGLNGVSAKTVSYVALSGDNGKAITFNCPGACSLTLPASVPASPWTIFTSNEGVAALSIIPTSGSNLYVGSDVALGTGTLNPGMGVSIWSDGTNYHINQGGIITGSNSETFVAQSAITSCGAGECDLAFPSDVVPGHTIIANYMHSEGGTQVISDTNGDNFGVASVTNYGGEFDLTQYVVCSAVGGPTTIKNTGTYSIVEVIEVQGVTTSSCVDGYSGGTDSGAAQPSSASTGAVTTTEPYDFVLVTAGTRGANTQTITEANGYTPLNSSGFIATALNYQSFYGVKPATGSLSDTVTGTGTNVTHIAGTITALIPIGSSNTLVEGDLLVVSGNGSLIRLPAGTSGNCLVSNGSLTIPTYQTCVTSNPVSGMTSGQVAIAGSATTITGSKALAGTGSAIPTGPSSTTSNDCVKYTGTAGQQADAGIPCGGSGSPYPAPVTLIASSSAELDFTTCISSSYRDYEIRFSHVVLASASQNLYVQVSTDGGSTYDSTSGHYKAGYIQLGLAAATPALTGNPNTSFIGFFIGGYDTVTPGPVDGVLYLYDLPNSTAVKGATMSAAVNGSTNSDFNQGGEQYNQTAAVNAVRVIASGSTNIASGTVVCQPLPQ